MNFRAAAAEFVATFFFVLAGIASVLAVASGVGSAGPVGPALAHGLALAIVVSLTMHISGGQVNPAVTLGVWLGNQITFRQAIANIVAQVLGALLAVQTLVFCFGLDRMQEIGYGTPSRGPAFPRDQAMLLEGLFTALLVLVVFGTAVDKRAHKMAGLFIGFTITVAALTIGPFTGACLNPARYLGPALIGGNTADWRIYVASTILGGAVAALLYTYFLGREEKLDLPGEGAA